MLQELGSDPVAVPSCCPNCGFNIVRSMPLKMGSLFIDKSDSAVWWNDRLVRLTLPQRLIVAALVRARGYTINRATLAELEGYDGESAVAVANAHICNIRKAFRTIDPSFDRIETVWGQGVKWKP